MEIHSFRAIVNLEFLLVLSNVFTSALVSDESVASTPVALQQPSPAIVRKDKPESTVNITDEEPPQITVQISIKDPNIVLLADARDKNTNALFLKVSKLHTTAAFNDISLHLAYEFFFKKVKSNTNTHTLEFYCRKINIFFFTSILWCLCVGVHRIHRELIERK